MKKKMRKHLMIILISSITFPSISQINNVDEFAQYVDSIGLQFTMPEGYTVTEVKKNRDLKCDFAIINADSSMEVRYSIWSLKPMIEQYKESLKNENETMMSPNSFYKGIIQSNVLNMTAGEGAEIGSFPPDAVKKEFNADVGGTSFFIFNCEFGKGYKYGQFVYLHKDDIADLIITYMSNNMETHSGLMMIPFHSLRFKE